MARCLQFDHFLLVAIWQYFPGLPLFSAEERMLRPIFRQSPKCLLQVQIFSEASCLFCFFFLFKMFVCLRKISPELTTASLPLFAEEDWPYANVHAHLPPLYMWGRLPQHGFYQAVPCLHLGSEPVNPGLPRSGMCAFNRCATRLAWHEHSLFFCKL